MSNFSLSMIPMNPSDECVYCRINTGFGSGEFLIREFIKAKNGYACSSCLGGDEYYGETFIEEDEETWT